MHRVNRTFWILGGLVLAALVVAGFIGFGYWGMHGGYMGPWMMRGYYGRGFGFPFFLPVIGIILVLLIIGGLFARRRHMMGYRNYWTTQGHSESAIEILNRRYAAGEITKEEYEAKKKDIS